MSASDSDKVSRLFLFAADNHQHGLTAWSAVKVVEAGDLESDKLAARAYLAKLNNAGKLFDTEDLASSMYVVRVDIRQNDGKRECLFCLMDSEINETFESMWEDLQHMENGN